MIWVLPILLFLLWIPSPASAANHAQTDFDCQTVEQIPVHECAALVELYDLTDGGNWLNNEGWLQTARPCEWHGIMCDGSEHVTRVFLEENQLNGSIPPSIGDLSELTWLQLFGNQLSGSIPPELGKLEQVTWLRLEENELTGSIPPELGTMSALESLYLSSNPLTGPIPPELGNLSALSKLYLSDTQVSGAVPPELGNLALLEFLLLNDTGVSGPLPGTFVQLDALTFLQIQRSGLCEPQDAAFQSWLADLTDFYGEDVACGDGSAEIGSSSEGATAEEVAQGEPQDIATTEEVSATITPQSASTATTLPTRIRPTDGPTDAGAQVTSAGEPAATVAEAVTPISQNDSSQNFAWRGLLGVLLLMFLLAAGMVYGWWIGRHERV